MTAHRLASTVTACPCGRPGERGRPLPYEACCGRYLDHWDDCPAPDAESLMRSRYTAFVRGRADYLLATWDVADRPPSLELDPATRWLGLEVREVKNLGLDAAEVEFIARYRDAGQAGRAVRLHERSRFRRAGGRWLYASGAMRERKT